MYDSAYCLRCGSCEVICRAIVVVILKTKLGIACDKILTKHIGVVLDSLQLHYPEF